MTAVASAGRTHLLRPEHPSLSAAGKRVFIAMATFNGERFIEKQIASLKHQSFADWTLLIRDDQSSDATPALLQRAAAADLRLRLVRDGLGNLGAVGNFGALMERALAEEADYLFFADQDDEWHPDKLAYMLEAMRKLEVMAGRGVPLLVHSDLAVVDEAGTEIAGSFIRYSRLSPESADLGVLLCQNQVTGCAALVNRELLELACPMPQGVLMHDWWLAQLAIAAGRVGFAPCALVRYRQHGSNVLGAISLWSRVHALLTSRGEWQKFAQVVRGSVRQARLLQRRLTERGYALSAITSGRLETYASLLSRPRLKRPFLLREWKIGKPGWAKGWVFNMVVMSMKRVSDE